MHEEILREVQKRFQQDRFATINGAYIADVGEGYAKVIMELSEHHYNAVGAVMGGAIFTTADFAFAVASNWQGRDVVSQTAQITYLGRVKGDKIIAEAREVKKGRSSCYYTVEVRDNLGNLVAHLTSTGFYV